MSAPKWIWARRPRRYLPAGLSAMGLVFVIGATGPGQEGPPSQPAAAVGKTAPAAPAATEKISAPVAPVPSAGPGPLEITVLRAGQAPYAWGEPDAQSRRRPLLSFITDDAQTCRVAAWARVSGRPAANAAIHWQIEPPSGFALAGEPEPGPELRATLTRPEAPHAATGPFTVTVRARVELDGKQYETAATVTQDVRDQMRQEYVDLSRDIVPERHRFIDAEEYARRFGKRFSTIRFEDVNFSLNAATGERYPYAIISGALLLGLKRTERLLGTKLVFTSGYRNPWRQDQVHAPVTESQHQYGYAADLAVLPCEGHPVPDEADWLRMAEAACAVGACFVEPMEQCHPNTTSCHLHMDFRESGTVTVPVRVKGVVRDAATGQPVRNAIVTFAGMPARTGPNGYFAVRNVLSPRERPVLVEADGYRSLQQPLKVAAGTNEIQLTLDPGPRPVLTVVPKQAAWTNEAAGVGALDLRVENTGQVDATDVRLRAPGFQIAPERLPSLSAGKSQKVTVFFRRERGAAPGPLHVALSSTYQSPEGRALAQELSLEAQAPAWTTAPPAAIRAQPPAAPVAPTPAAPPAPAPHPTAANTAAAAAGSTAAILGAAVSLQRRKARKADEKAAPVIEERQPASLSNTSARPDAAKAGAIDMPEPAPAAKPEPAREGAGARP